MKKHRIGLYIRLVLAAGCIVMGFLSLAGAFPISAEREKLIFGVGWILIGAGWIFRCYLGWRSRPDDRGASDDS
jgi:hypothetical protein